MDRYKLDYGRIIQNVKALRNSKKITQQKLSELADLSVNTISKFEINQKNINLETFIKIANALDVDVNLLLGNTRDEPKKPVDSVIDSLLDDLTEEDKDLLVPIISALRIYSKKMNATPAPEPVKKKPLPINELNPVKRTIEKNLQL